VRIEGALQLARRRWAGSDFERRRAEIQARRGPAVGRKANSGSAGAGSGSARLTAAGASFSIIWLNSE